ncbi:MAG: ATP-binding protein [Chloroflexi bacterium]|nr:ATP-binding protein [Chloroflexota bacterium]
MTESVALRPDSWELAMRNLKTDLLGQWIRQDWLPNRRETDLHIIPAARNITHGTVLAEFEHTFSLPGRYQFVGVEAVPCPVVTPITTYRYDGRPDVRTGAYLYRFAQPQTGTTAEVLVIAAVYNDHNYGPIHERVTFACLPAQFVPVWADFEAEVDRRVYELDPRMVHIIGGRSGGFVPSVDWDDVILDDALKTAIMDDVESFFTRGVGIYQRLKLKPFRKLLLAGVPGTGKTMLCSALAKWALERNFRVIYVSSADCDGPTFKKIEQALSIAAHSQHPALIIVEELDAYLHEKEKAIVLNVLDGAESASNDHGTLLITTTNYPEAIDERLLKRPGRLDRIFIVPPLETPDEAEQMLKLYLGDLWREEHRAVVGNLIGYPGAFVREVAIHALTLAAYDELTALPLELLQRSFKKLSDQLAVGDDFLRQRVEATRPVGKSSNDADDAEA